nr:cysteine proteinase inhibitor B [Tanacetum cinerariifolium]
MRRLEASGTYTDDEINRLARRGKQRGHILGSGRVLSARVTSGPSRPAPESTLKSLHKKMDFMMSLFKSDSKFSDAFSQFESVGASGSGGCGDDEEGADHQDDEDGDGDSQLCYILEATFCKLIRILDDLALLCFGFGGRTKIKDVKNNQEVQELGKYCVEENNRKVGSNGLKFVEVVKAESQVVSGTKYYLTIQAVSSIGCENSLLDAEIVVKPWVHSNELLTFRPGKGLK